MMSSDMIPGRAAAIPDSCEPLPIKYPAVMFPVMFRFVTFPGVQLFDVRFPYMFCATILTPATFPYITFAVIKPLLIFP